MEKETTSKLDYNSEIYFRSVKIEISIVSKIAHELMYQYHICHKTISNITLSCDSVLSEDFIFNYQSSNRNVF